MRGKIPWFTPAPKAQDGEDTNAVAEGRAGRLGEMPKKRKRDESEGVTTSASTPLPTEKADAKNTVVNDEEEDDDEEFEGFDEDDESGDGVEEAASEDEDDMIPLEGLSDSESSSDGEEHG